MVVKIRKKFLKINCGRAKNYLWERGIQLQVMVAKEKKQNFNLSKRATTMKQIKIVSSAQDCKKLLKDKLQTNEGKFPVSKIFITWTYHLPFLSF